MSSKKGFRLSTAGRSSPNDWMSRDYGESEYYFKTDEDDDDSNESKKSSSQGTRAAPTPKLVRSSGAKRKLGEILERMHRGEILSQHEVSAAIQDYNRLEKRIAQLEQKTVTAELHVPDEVADGIGAPGEKLHRDERAKLTHQIKRKDRIIEEYQKRLRNLQHNEKTKSIKSVKTSDVAPPERIIETFFDMYENEWLNAFLTLKSTFQGDDEKSVFYMFRIVRHAYIFCFDIAETQRSAIDDFSARLQEIMLHPSFTHPISKLKYKPGAEVTSENQRHLDVGLQLIQDYRGIMVTQTIPAVQELFRKVKLPELFESGLVSKAVRDFVNKTVELIWLMVVQDPPMMVYWLEPKQTVVKEYFKYFKKKGSLVQQTVWPAIFSKDGGDILSKGVVMACEEDDFHDLRHL